MESKASHESWHQQEEKGKAEASTFDVRFHFTIMIRRLDWITLTANLLHPCWYKFESPSLHLLSLNRSQTNQELFNFSASRWSFSSNPVDSIWTTSLLFTNKSLLTSSSLHLLNSTTCKLNWDGPCAHVSRTWLPSSSFARPRQHTDSDIPPEALRAILKIIVVFY